MAGLSSAPEGDDKQVDHGKTMRKAYEQFKGPKEMFVNKEAFKALDGKKAVVARNWRGMDEDRRKTTIDELIGIQEKLEKGQPVAPNQLEGFMVLKEVLPKVFGMTIDNVMDLRRGELEAEMREAEEFTTAERAIDDYDSEAEGSQLDGTAQIDPFKKPE